RWRMPADLCVACVAMAVAYEVRFHGYPKYIPGGEPPDPTHYALVTPVAALIVVVTFALMGVYRQGRGIQFIDEVFSVLGALAVAFVVVLAMFFYLREQTFNYSRLTAIYWVLAAAVLLVLARYGIRRYEAAQRARGNGADRALLVGWGAAADLLVQRLRMFPDYGYHLVGILADRLEP